MGTSLGATRGLLLRGGDVLEKFAAVDTIVFDKTGTLTIGKPVVTRVVPYKFDEHEHSKLSVIYPHLSILIEQTNFSSTSIHSFDIKFKIFLFSQKVNKYFVKSRYWGDTPTLDFLLVSYLLS